MKRTIKFRGKYTETGEWVYGYYARLSNEFKEWHCIMTEKDASENYIKDCNGFHMQYTPVVPSTVGQFTGRLDKEGKEIYDGDMVEYYEPDSFCINPDCEPHLRCYGTIIRKRTEEVVYKDCTFGIDHDTHIQSLACCGLIEDDIEWMKEQADEDVYFDANGFAIDESILGIKVVGNIHEKKGGEE